MKMNPQEKHISYEWFRTNIRFDNEAKGCWKIDFYSLFFRDFYVILKFSKMAFEFSEIVSGRLERRIKMLSTSRLSDRVSGINM